MFIGDPAELLGFPTFAAAAQGSSEANSCYPDNGGGLQGSLFVVVPSHFTFRELILLGNEPAMNLSKVSPSSYRSLAARLLANACIESKGR